MSTAAVNSVSQHSSSFSGSHAFFPPVSLLKCPLSLEGVERGVSLMDGSLLSTLTKHESMH